MKLRSTAVGSTFALVVALAVVACSSGEEADTASKTGTPGDVVVAASDDTKTSLGVTEWHIATDDAGDLVAAGYDADGQIVASVGSHATFHTKETATFALEVKAAESFTLRYDYAPGTVTSNAERMAAEAPTARAVLVQLASDVSRHEAEGTQLVGTSVRPLMGQGSGANGTRLVQPGQQRLVREGTCLLDSSGNGCVGNLVQFAGSLLGTAACLLSTPVTTAAGAVCVGAAGTAVVGMGISLYEQGCKPRPCRSAPTS